MATCITSQWVSTAPQARLTVTQTASTHTSATLSWKLEYIASSPANTDGTGRSYSVVIDGDIVKYGSYNINGVAGIKTIASGTKTITKGSSAKTVAFFISFGFNLTWSGQKENTLTANGSISVAAKDTRYVIAFNANGGTGAPVSQIKWQGESITLSSDKPTRFGYSFVRWNTNTSNTGTAYSPGATYSTNANVTLYAIWKANTYTVSYNANGGTGAPANQTKTYGVDLTLSDIKPTKNGYTFLKWNTNSSGTETSYNSGATYSGNYAITLYAVWTNTYKPPRINNVSVERCDQNGTLLDNGPYAKIIFNWSSDEDVLSITIRWKYSGGSWSTAVSPSGSISGTSGSINQVFGDGLLFPEKSYTVEIKVTDSLGNTVITRNISSQFFTLDLKAGGKGVAIGKAAEEDLFDVGFKTKFTGGIAPILLPARTNLNDLTTPNIYYSSEVSDPTAGAYTNCPITIGSFSLEVFTIGDNNGGAVKPIKQRLSSHYYDSRTEKYASKTFERLCTITSNVYMTWGEWVKVSDYGGSLLASPGMFMNGTQSVTLAEKVSVQRSGIVLVFSEYSGGLVNNTSFNCHFIPKMVITMYPGAGHVFQMSSSNLAYYTTKFLYISDTTITGHANNDQSFGTSSNPTSSSIASTNNRFVLRYVIGV